MVNISKALILYLVFCCVNVDASNYQELISKENEPWVKKLVDRNFSLTPFANVILGSKPMACTLIDKVSDPGAIAEIENDPEIPQKFKDHRLRLAKQQDINTEWQKWMVLKSKLPIKNFLFRTEPCAIYDEYYFGMIINVREVLWILEKHYTTFSRQLDMQFDPLKVTLEFENPDSLFWRKTLSDHYLQGILYGFGERNAFFFSLASNHDYSYDHGIFLCPKMRDTIPARVDVPKFRSFYTPLNKEDPIIDKVAKEVAKINELLDKSDPFELIIRHLTQ